MRCAKAQITPPNMKHPLIVVCFGLLSVTANCGLRAEEPRGMYYPTTLRNDSVPPAGRPWANVLGQVTLDDTRWWTARTSYAGSGEPPVTKMLTQMYGARMNGANATCRPWNLALREKKFSYLSAPEVRIPGVQAGSSNEIFKDGKPSCSLFFYRVVFDPSLWCSRIMEDTGVPPREK